MLEAISKSSQQETSIGGGGYPLYNLCGLYLLETYETSYSGEWIAPTNPHLLKHTATRVWTIA